MDPFVGQLVELCGDSPTRAKWVFVPSHTIGHTLGERLARNGCAWANLRFVTPLDVAFRMAAPFLVARGIDPSPEGLGPPLVMRLMLDLPPDTPAYFHHLADQPKMADALWVAIRELRLAGLAATDLREDAFERREKRAELHALLRAYEEYLATHRLADAADVYREALRHSEACPILPEQIWTELPGVVWAPLERQLLEALPAPRLEPASLEVPGLEVPRRLASPAGPPRRVRPAPGSDAERLAFLMKPGEAPPPFADGTVAMFRAGGRDAEVEEVMRRIVADGLPLDAVEVACAASEYGPLFWEKAQRHEWPVTVAQGVPATLTRPARALLAFCDWMEQNFAAGPLRRLLQSGDVRVEIEDGPTAGQAARLLARSGATWGRETYDAALAGLALAYREEAADPETEEDKAVRSLDRAARADRLKEWVGRLLALAPDPGPDGRVLLRDLLAGCAAFIRDFARAASPLDAEAAGALARTLDELRTLGDLTRPPGEALSLIRDRIEGTAVGADRARPGHLHVTTLRHAGNAGRSHTFVVGLEEGGVFPALVEDPVLLDDERAALGPSLATSQDRVGGALHATVTRLAVLGGHVWLSFSCRDLRENRETFPSWLLLQALRLKLVGRELTYQDLEEDLGDPVSTVPRGPDEALSEAGWWLAHVMRGAGKGGLPALRDTFPFLVRGEAAEAQRASDRFTSYDGLVPEAAARLDPRVSGRPVSATRLEGLAGCPFRYFLDRGLGIEPIEDAEPQPDQWLPPRTRGSALHALYAAILRELRAGGERPDPARHGPRLRAGGEEKLRELERLIPPPSRRIYEQERTAFLRDLDVFLSLEARSGAQTPEGLEVSFGAGAAEGEPLAQAEPVTIDLGNGLRFLLRGRIDRIDRRTDGAYEVVDYKTGRAFLPGGLYATFAGGRQLQHALYALAAAQLLRRQDPRARVTSSMYYFPTVRGNGQRPSRPQTDQKPLQAVLRDLFELLSAGAFIHTSDKDDCRFCQFHRACGPDPVDRAKRKVKRGADAAAALYARLEEHA